MRRLTSGILAGTAMALAACSPGGKATDPAPKTETTTAATTTATTAAAPAAAPAAPAGLFDGIAGTDRVPASLLPQMAAETAPHWARCGDDMVAEVLGADGKSQGFIVARGVSFTMLDTPIDVPSQKAGVTTRRGVNLRSASYFQYFGEGVTRTDISGRQVTKAGWGDEKRLTAPLPFWQAEETGGVWKAEFRRNATDAAEWQQRYRAADCTAVPPRA